jgi:CheY-like chemotaxis protein
MAHILVIEDHAGFRDTLTEMLRSAAHDVRSACNGREALDILTAENFDLLVTDVLMPEVDGIEVLNALKRMPAPLPVIAISGGGALPASLALSLSSALGARAVLFKPFYRQELIEAVQRALSH